MYSQPISAAAAAALFPMHTANCLLPGSIHSLSHMFTYFPAEVEQLVLTKLEERAGGINNPLFSSICYSTITEYMAHLRYLQLENKLITLYSIKYIVTEH